LQYKAIIAGTTVVVANRWFASSKVCSRCAQKYEKLKLSQRTWTCPSCNAFHDREENAAHNLARYAESSPASACGAEGADDDESVVVEPSAGKQEASFAF
jgi:putative transposase